MEQKPHFTALLPDLEQRRFIDRERPTCSLDTKKLTYVLATTWSLTVWRMKLLGIICDRQALAMLGAALLGLDIVDSSYSECESRRLALLESQVQSG